MITLEQATTEELYEELASREIVILLRIEDFDTDPKYVVWWNKQMSENVASMLLTEAAAKLEQQ